MADVTSPLNTWSTTASSNFPTDATSIGSGLDDNLREIQAVVRAALAYYNSTPVASASTTSIGSTAGNFLDISGTTTITAFDSVTAGIWKVIRFQGALTLTHGAALYLPGAANITTAANDVAFCYSTGSGNWVVPFYQPASGRPVIATVLDGSFKILNTSDTSKILIFSAGSISASTSRTLTAQDASGSIALTSEFVYTGEALPGPTAGRLLLPAGYITGLGTTWVTTTSLSVAAGWAVDSTGTVNIRRPSSLTCILGATWASGNSSNKLDTGSPAANTTYHIYVIRRNSDGASDVLFSASASSPTMPSGYTYFRRIGSFISNASTQIERYVQDGDDFWWYTITADTTTICGTTATSVTLDNGSTPRVPNGLRVKAYLQAYGDGGVTSAIAFRVYDTSLADVALSGGTADSRATAGGGNFSTVARLTVPVDVWTSTSRQVRVVCEAASKAVSLSVLGWMDTRGKNV